VEEGNFSPSGQSGFTEQSLKGGSEEEHEGFVCVRCACTEILACFPGQKPIPEHGEERVGEVRIFDLPLGRHLANTLHVDTQEISY
jgi:hypothetical protein